MHDSNSGTGSPVECLYRAPAATPPTMREFLIHKALDSTRSLAEVLDELTEAEVLHVLDTEVGSRRRSVMVERLIAKAAELHSANYVAQLKEKYKWPVPNPSS